MTKHPDLLFRRDLMKLACLILAIVGTVAVFIVTPALSTPTLLSMVVAILLSPGVALLERRGYPRALAITLFFTGIFAIIVLFGAWGIQASISEWQSLTQKAPEHFHLVMEKIKTFESNWKHRYPILSGVHLTDTAVNWGQQTGQWFVDNGPALMGQIVTWIFIIPFLSFVLLNEGRMIRKRFFQLVPNRYFESFFLITNEISNAISDYIRAKLVEAILVGFMVTIGLALIKAPYIVVLGIIAGITNIVPYLGPLLGAIPGVFAATLDPHGSTVILSVSLVYIIANVIDMVVIFPLVVAKLVKLHPLILVAVVAAGQHYYGLVGMLISVPIATALKVVFQEIYGLVYEHIPNRPTWSDAPEVIQTIESPR